MLVGPVHENVVYGVANGETLLLDVFEPANNTGLPRPGILLIHGGAWNSFDKSTMRPLAHFLALAGFVAIPVDYRLFNNDINHWPAQLDDVQMAVRWVRANSEKYNIDRNHIGAYGHSAGGQLALLLGMTDTRDNSDPALAKYSSKVQAVVDAAGPTDFTTQTDKDGIEYMTSFSERGLRETSRSVARCFSDFARGEIECADPDHPRHERRDGARRGG